MVGEEFLISAMLLGMLAGAHPGDAAAAVNINIGIGAPLPAVVLAAPPQVVLIPGSPVYYAPDAGINLFFYSGRWYRRHNNGWYRASYYNGPWAYMPPSRVPAAFVRIPGNYYRPMPYGLQKKRWREEEREHHEHGERHHRHDED